MAPTCTAKFSRLVQIICLLSLFCHASAECQFPKYMLGDWFSMQQGESISMLIDDRHWAGSICVEKYDWNKPVIGTIGANHTFLIAEPPKVGEGLNTQCYKCVDVLWRTPNVLQIKLGNCLTKTNEMSVNTSCNSIRAKRLPSVDEVITLFKTSHQTNVNCITTFEGVYQFTYEVDYGGGGICNNKDSQIRACQDPGSQYVDNQVFRMTYAKCRDVVSSKNKQIRYQCYGTWYAVRGSGSGTIGYTFAAVSDTVEKDPRERFKCLMTLRNQKDTQNKIRWVMSRFADCSTLNSIYNGPVRLVLTRIPPTTPFLAPQCSLPRNITGTWMTQGLQYRSDIRVNETHIYYTTWINEFEYQETYYSCQQSQGSRYLFTKVVVGRCEVDFTCFDIVPRHHSIVRYRVGKPYPYKMDSENDNMKDFLTKTFRSACSWVQFTFNRDDYKWKYNTMILNPPSPVPCPIAGRYTFKQTGRNSIEEYQTRIRGVTEKPRVKVACRNWITEFKSCSDAMTRIQVDAEYCESVDYRGRPIGEYDEPDNILTCVGFWMEDMRSYLITWDEEDAISEFRCWVYERKSWTGIFMSRAQNARCPKIQHSTDYNMDGTGLHLDLTENERLFDNCPQRFDPGADPYNKPITLWVLSGSGHIMPSVITVIVAVLSILFIKYH